MFAYCNNNPVNCLDYYGTDPGDYFNTIDEAAMDAAIYMGISSFKTGIEFSATIYSITQDITIRVPSGFTRQNITLSSQSHRSDNIYIYVRYKIITVQVTKYTYDQPITNYELDRVDMRVNANSVAVVHTHPWGSGKGITSFSPDDLQMAEKVASDFNMNFSIYVYGPNGELKKYDTSNDDITIISSNLPKSNIKWW